MDFDDSHLSVSRHDDNDDIVVRDGAGAIIANFSVDTQRDWGMSEEEHRRRSELYAKLFAHAPKLLKALEGLLGDHLCAHAFDPDCPYCFARQTLKETRSP